MWLRQHGATSAEIPVYVSDLRELRQPSTLQYECQLETLKEMEPAILFTLYE